VLAPSSRVEAAASSIRNRILLVGLVVLAAVMLLAYALAPLIGRARLGQEQRALAERVLRHVTDAVALLDAGGVIRFWNRAAETITGVTAERAVGARADDVVGGWPEALEQIPIVDAQSLGAATAAATVPLESDDGEVWIAVSGVRVDEGVVYTFRDVSESERLDQAKADFVATVSHELRTPLASVYGAAMTLRQHDTRLSERQRDDLLALLAEQADRLSSIIDDILFASKLDSGRLHVKEERCDPEHVARAVVDAARVRAGDRVEIELATPPWLPDLAADSDKVAQVLANLVENAVKYSPGGGLVEVAVEQHDDRIRFEVRDEGLGIPLGEQERIFEKFYRLDPNLTRGIGGTGLGLYISSELVRRMGGEIQVRSRPGEGSVFWFDLPAAEALEPVPAES
jgi:two-component system phosphate regulon sensor histidine kinase PhoR